jgi:hypothetical protein
MLAVAAAAAPAAAQTMQRSQGSPPIKELRIAVVDPSSGREVALLGRGDALQIRVGDELRLEMVDPGEARRSSAFHVPASFELRYANTGLQLLRPDPARGTVVVRARELPTSDRGPEIEWRIAQNVKVAGENLRWGHLNVEPLQAAPAPGSGQSAAERAVDALYRGILLREADEGAAGYRDRIAREGHSGAARVAHEIAESRESEVEVYAKGSCNQQRLLALYQHLLGVDANRVDQRRFREQLQRMERGDVAGVVDELVQTREFASRFGLS